MHARSYGLKTLKGIFLSCFEDLQGLIATVVALLTLRIASLKFDPFNQYAFIDTQVVPKGFVSNRRSTNLGIYEHTPLVDK